MLRKSLVITVLLSILIVHCTTIYNYDISISGLEEFPATRDAVMQYIPTSIDAQKGSIANNIEYIKRDLNAHESEIADSLRVDLNPLSDTLIELTVSIHALDPENETYTSEYTHSYNISP